METRSWVGWRVGGILGGGLRAASPDDGTASESVQWIGRDGSVVGRVPALNLHPNLCQFAFLRAADPVMKSMIDAVGPYKKTSHAIAAPWRPYASVASWYCWRTLDLTRNTETVATGYPS